MLLTVVPPNVPEAPLGAVNVTLAFCTGFPDESFTVTAKGFAKRALISADCGVDPALAVIAAAGPVWFVRKKGTGVSPNADATTL